ncbi:MAG: V-type ATP synthase subunit E family protein [Clostridia bacterium]|nr:V-type ATP synthase subunit E family protein [Clostridia bacterium]
MQSVSNKDKLLSRIIGDAEADASRVREQTEQTLQSMDAECQRSIDELKAVHLRNREQAIAAIMDGNRTRAALDGRKADLASRRLVIDKVFEKAYEELLRLESGKRLNLFRSILTAEAVAGDTIIPSPVDRAGLRELLSGLDIELKLSNEDAKIDGGFIIRGKSYEKDCSMKSVLDLLRTEEETAVAVQLFQ